jgi:1,2-dihydroxy-3-keto-5-methylthiopentene dioxygenase
MRAHYRTTEKPLSAADLEAHGVHFRHLGLDRAVFQPVLDTLSTKNGYGTQDEVKLGPDTPNLAQVLKKFDDEHLHSDDEVRFVLDGEAVFDIRSTDDRWMRVVVEAGDLIVVPKGRNHRFELGASGKVHCVRLFKDPSGWVPEYRPNPPAG